MDISEAFQTALSHHRQGRAAEAARLYERVLEQDSDHFHALDLLGVICVESGRFDAAADYLARAAAIRPDLGRTQAYLGFALRRLGRPVEAVAALDRALALGHRTAEALNSRGVALLDLGRFEEAAADCDAALALAPDMAMAAMNAGLALTRLERFEEALARFDRVIALTPSDAGAWLRRGGAEKALGRLDAALASFNHAIALDPGFAHAHHQRGELLDGLGRTEAALASVETAVRLAPDLATAQFSHGQLLLKLGRHEAAAQSFGRVSEIDPDFAAARWNRAFCVLPLGRFREGWQDYESRWGAPDFLSASRGHVTPDLQARIRPSLQRPDVAGRDVLLASEQGIGDVIMFASILPDLAAEAKCVTLIAERRLHRLFSAAFPAVALLEPQRAAPPPPAEVFIPLGSLGRLYRNSASDFPGTPYLCTRPETRAQWRKRMGPPRGLRVGISWRGGTDKTRRAERSLPLRDLGPLLDLPDCEFVSLQYGDVAAEIAAENLRHKGAIRSLDATDIEDFEDLAALVQTVDLVVSVQTAIVHLAGALGAPTLVMTPKAPEWRYGAAGSAMPWYASVRIFRMSSDEGWAPLVEQVAEAVHNWRRPAKG